MMRRCTITINFLSMLLHTDVIGRTLECRCLPVCMSEPAVGTCGFHESVGARRNSAEV